MKRANLPSWLLLAVAGFLTTNSLLCQQEVALVHPIRVREILPPAGAQKRLEPSGLVLFRNRLLIVSDENDIAEIYELKPQDAETLQAEPFLSLSPIPGFKGEDLEGITYCNERLYLVEEMTHTVAEIGSDGKAVAHPLDLSSVKTGKNGAPHGEIPGAGIEGIACDEAAGILYVARERQPRMIYSVALSNYKTMDAFDVPAGWDSPRTGGGRLVYADYSDLYFEGGFLYALQRSDRTILKISPEKKSLVSKLRLDFQESQYYDYKEPFGMAEGLYLTRERIFVVLDNNGVARIGDPQNTSPLLLEFARPSSF